MSFTITCDNCGGKQTFTAASKMCEDRIAFEIYMMGTYQQYPQDMTISCENSKCPNYVSINC